MLMLGCVTFARARAARCSRLFGRVGDIIRSSFWLFESEGRKSYFQAYLLSQIEDLGLSAGDGKIKKKYLSRYG